MNSRHASLMHSRLLRVSVCISDAIAGRAASSAVVTAARIVVAGGHSAGHIEPAMNFADAVRRLDPSAEITALGTERGLDTTLIPARGYPLELVPPVPLPRRLSRALLATPGKLRASVHAAGLVLDRTAAEVVVGFGGYVAVPAYLAARRAAPPDRRARGERAARARQPRSPPG